MLGLFLLFFGGQFSSSGLRLEGMLVNMWVVSEQSNQINLLKYVTDADTYKKAQMQKNKCKSMKCQIKHEKENCYGIILVYEQHVDEKMFSNDNHFFQQWKQMTKTILLRRIDFNSIFHNRSHSKFNSCQLMSVSTSLCS